MKISERVPKSHKGSTIPNDLCFAEILPHLPARSLFRFKSVSKQWNSFISSTDFIILHMKLNVNNNNLILASGSRTRYANTKLFNLRFNCERFKVSALMNYYSNNDSILKDHRRKSYLIGCCHGLICHFHSEKFILSNPSIGKLCYLLPDPNWDTNPALFSKVAGFGYDSSTDDYKIVFLSNLNTWCGYLFSLRNKKWNQLDTTFFTDPANKIYSNSIFSCFFEPKIYGVIQINDALHWLFVYKYHDTFTSFFLIFHLAKEEFSIVHLQSLDDNIIGFTQIKGCLCRVHYQRKAQSLGRKTPRLEVQMLEKYGEWDSWKTFYVCDLGMTLGRDYMNFFELRDSNGDNKIFILKHKMNIKNAGSLRVYFIDSKCPRMHSEINIEGGTMWLTRVCSLPESLVWPSYFPKA